MENKLRNSFMKASVRNIDAENYEITHTVNTKALDRYDTIVLPKGADVSSFLKNAVVLWSHNGDSSLPKIPIGKCVELNIEEDAVVVKTKFNPKDELAMKVFNAYKDGFLHAWSIGFIPTKYKRFDAENFADLNKKYSLEVTENQIENAAWGLYLIYEWELLEYSAVPVPANPEALSVDEDSSYKRELITRGLTDKSINSVNFRDIVKRDEDAKEKEEKKVEDESEEKAKKEYDCECLDCGEEVTSSKHCKDLKCPKCGGEMRRKDRPGTGKDVEGDKKEVKEEIKESEAEEKKVEDSKDKEVKESEEAKPKEKVEDSKDEKAEESKEEDSKKEEKKSVEKVEDVEDKEKAPDDVKDPKDEVPEVKKESADEAEAMVDAAKREADAETKAQEDAQEEAKTKALEVLTESVNTLVTKVTELSEKVVKLEAKSVEVDTIKKDFKAIVDEIGSENIDAIRQIESEKLEKDSDPSKGFWHKLLTDR